MLNQESIIVVGAALSTLLAITGFLSAQAFNRLSRELERGSRERRDLDTRLTRIEAQIEIESRGQN